MIGKTVGNYKIIKELGRGGMGVVYKAHQISLDRMVAMKVLPQHLTSDAAFIKRFENEARAIASLNHPNIVQIYDIGHEGDVHYYTMEFIDGSSLDQIIYREGCLSVERACNVILQVARALHYAHQHGIIHRDIKPSNIIFDKSNRAKVADFGLALQERTTRLTVDGSIVGTPEYMSPEQAIAEPATVRSDIYSLGVVFYELLTGKVPFEGESALVILKKIESLEPTWPRSLKPEIPLEVEKVVQKMMAKKPRARYANCEELIRDIIRLKSGQSIPMGERRTAAPKLALAAIAVAIVLGAIVFYRTRPHTVEAPPPNLLELGGKLEAPEPEGIASIPPPEVQAAREPSPSPATPEEALARVKRDLAALEQRLEEVRSTRAAPEQLWADTIIFKKGNKLRCEIDNESLDKVRIKTTTGLADIPRDEISLVVYATPEEKKAAQAAALQEQQRQEEEQRIRNEIEQLERKKGELVPTPPPKVVQKERDRPLRPLLAQEDEEKQPEAGVRAETLSLPLAEDRWHTATSCGKKNPVSFERDAMVVVTSQKTLSEPCSVTLESDVLLKNSPSLVELLVDVKRLVTADDRVRASVIISFDNGNALEYPFFDSDTDVLKTEITQTPTLVRISRPENTLIRDKGWQTLRLPVTEDAAKINKGEKRVAARLSLKLEQFSGGVVFLFRYKAIVITTN